MTQLLLPLPENLQDEDLEWTSWLETMDPFASSNDIQSSSEEDDEEEDPFFESFT